ncbi:MAG: CDP-diacylglycerol--glycerol-3-phosphate 3-phosphatidyltransferase [SAR202 cluster bacterium]|nr:CDP-diacylglycerol--glycerol-3-phosphate 3-phosphatidyltransferase [SAR202 cluster bacterium]MQG51958.1 CDP-diacylglycerol--glycerol-3-phosphate 3-phosphatidyltransferase [SAR202 cluster bacterium]
MNIPTVLTILRLIATPIIIILIYIGSLSNILPEYSIVLVVSAGILFAIAAITDFIDGKLARSTSQVTKLGTFLDPIADKFMVCCVLATLILVYSETNYRILFTILTTAVISREILITGLREWTARMRVEETSAVSQSGKMKAGFQMTGITMLILALSINNNIFTQISMVIFGIGVLLGLTSAYGYMKASIKTFI